MMIWDDLPAEICTDILCRLPVKTLIRCTTLSKFFHNLITNPSFITAHLSRIDNKHLLFRQVPPPGNKETYIIQRDDEDTFSGFKNEGIIMPIEYDESTWGSGWNVLGSINGVICLVDDLDYQGTTFLLWNPCIRKFVQLPKPLYVFDLGSGHSSASGFGFDRVTNDYKVVRIVHFEPDLVNDWPRPMVEVYSLRSGCWKSLGHGLDYQIRRCPNLYAPCFVNGCVHWVGHSYRGQRAVNVIVKFEVSSEAFGVIQVPSAVKEIYPLGGGTIPNLMVKECSGMLALISRHMENSGGLMPELSQRFMDLVNEPLSCSIWVLKEYEVVDSWTKVFDFDGTRSSAPFAFGFRNNGEIIVAKAGCKDSWTRTLPYVLVSIDQKHRETVIGRHGGKGRLFYLSPYQESMVLFHEGRSSPLAEESREDCG